MRLTRKPGALRQGSGNFPIRLTNDIARVTYASSVESLRTTSTRGSRATGLKKCNPRNRPGCSIPSERRSRSMLDVFVASTASGRICRSRSVNNACLASSRSTIASMTRSASATPAAFGTSRALASSAAPGALRRRRNNALARSSAGSTRSSDRSWIVTSNPRSAHQAAMSPPITPAPATWTCRISLDLGARPRRRSRRKNTRTRFWDVGVLSSRPMDRASASYAAGPRAPWRTHRSTSANGAG